MNLFSKISVYNENHEEVYCIISWVNNRKLHSFIETLMKEDNVGIDENGDYIVLSNYDLGKIEQANSNGLFLPIDGYSEDSLSAIVLAQQEKAQGRTVAYVFEKKESILGWNLLDKPQQSAIIRASTFN